MTNLPIVTNQQLTPGTLDMLLQITNSSERVEIKKPELVKKLIFCYENGLPLSVALNGGLYVVNGRHAVESNIIAAQIKKHPRYNYKIVSHDGTHCKIEFYDGDDLIGVSEFNEADAKQANLFKKDLYQKFPKAMYFNRAISQGYKWHCPDIFSNSVYVRGEIENKVIEANEVIEGEIATPQEAFSVLCNQHGHDTVVNACNGILPQTTKDIEQLAQKLERD